MISAKHARKTANAVQKFQSADQRAIIMEVCRMTGDDKVARWNRPGAQGECQDNF